MPRIKQPFTADHRNKRDAILLAAKARGLTRRRMAEFAGLKPGPASDMRLSRWVNGTQPIPDAMVAAIEAGVFATAPTVAGDDGVPAPTEVMAATIQQAEELAGEPDPGERDALRGLAKRHRRVAVGTLVRLMVSGKAESTRLNAALAILDRADGKAIQSVLDLTPKAPATSSELVDAVQRAIDDHAARKAREMAAESADVQAS